MPALRLRALLAGPVLLICACTTSSPRAAAVPPQIAELNHLFATVDPITAEAIRTSEFLRRFAHIEVRTTTGTRSSWTGRYLYGRRTYIEFFAPEDFTINDRPAPVGAWGIALSGDRVGSNALLKARIEEAGNRTVEEVDTRKLGDRVVPWFHALTAVSSHGDSGALGETVSVWAMEYLPSYFELPEAAKEPAEGPHDIVSRERYQSDSYATRMMRDITYVQFNIGPADFARIEPLLGAAGYRLRRTANLIVADGEEADFHFVLTTPAAQGLRQVRFKLNSRAAPRTEVIGRSVLVIGPGTSATWTFDPPSA